MLRGRRRSLVAAALVALAGCGADRDPGTLPGGSLTPEEAALEVGTVAPGYQPYVDALATNFTDGGRLVARLDPDEAACAATRWVAILGPDDLQAAGIEAAAMTDVTLEALAAAVTIDEPMARALTASYGACGADQTGAFLDSLLLTSQITPDQRVCLDAQLPDGLIGSITVSVLTDERLDDTLAAQYAAALDACSAG